MSSFWQRLNPPDVPGRHVVIKPFWSFLRSSILVKKIKTLDSLQAGELKQFEYAARKMVKIIGHGS